MCFLAITKPFTDQLGLSISHEILFHGILGDYDEVEQWLGHRIADR